MACDHRDNYIWHMNKIIKIGEMIFMFMHKLYPQMKLNPYIRYKFREQICSLRLKSTRPVQGL